MAFHRPHRERSLRLISRNARPDGDGRRMEACDIRLEAEGSEGGGLFPHARVRDGQAEFLEDARMCISQRTHLLAHAPTGLGKTAVALTAALETAVDERAVVLYLTSRQSQHAIAVETARAIWRKHRIGAIDLIGREDMCLAGRAVPPCQDGRACFFARGRCADAAEILLEYPMHVQEAGRTCLRERACPYASAVMATRSADLVIADYNHAFSASPLLLDRLGRPAKDVILVVDEAHNLPTRVMENYSASVGVEAVEAAISSPALRHFHDDLRILKDCCEMASKGTEWLDREVLDGPLKRSVGVDCGGLAEEMGETLRRKGERQHRDLLAFLSAWSWRDGMVRYAEGTPAKLHARLVDPSVACREVFTRVRSALLMSGTLHPPSMFADILGVESAVCREYPSPFPQENRLVLTWGGITSRFRMRNEAFFRNAAARLAEVCEATPGNVAAFFPSYDMLERTRAHLDVTSRNVVAERRGFGKNEQDAVVETLSRSSDNIMLATLSGALYEGVDFRDNSLSAVVVVGLPLAPPSRENLAYREQLERRLGPRKGELYSTTYPALIKVLQAAGRAIRSERDRAAIILMDDRYQMPGLRAALPADFAASRVRDVGGSLATFFDEH